jgi:hypothetical protein
MKADAFEREVDFFQSLLAEVGNAQQIFARAVQQIANGEDPSFLETVRCTNGQANLGSAQLQAFLHRARFFFCAAQWNARRHGSLPVLKIENAKAFRRGVMKTDAVRPPTQPVGLEYSGDPFIAYRIRKKIAFDASTLREF